MSINFEDPAPPHFDPPAPPSAKPPLWKRHRTLVLGASLLGVLLLAGTAWGSFSYGHRHEPTLRHQLAVTKSKVSDLESERDDLQVRSDRQAKVVTLCQDAVGRQKEELSKALDILSASLDDYLYIATLSGLNSLEDTVNRDQGTVDACQSADSSSDHDSSSQDS